MDIPPIQFLFWSLDEIYTVAVDLIWGIWFDQLLLGMLMGWLMIRVYRRFRDRHPDGHLSHRLYWLGFYFSRSKTLPNPYVRVFHPCRKCTFLTT